MCVCVCVCVCVRARMFACPPRIFCEWVNAYLTYI